MVSEDSALDLSEPECGRSRSAKSTPIAAEFLPAAGQVSPSITTSENLAGNGSGTMATQLAFKSFAAASRVKTSRSLVAALASLANEADYGLNTPDLLATFDPNSLSWKTSQSCLVEGLETFSDRWPRSGTMRSGTAYQLPPLVPLISETGSGLLPTPTARDWQDKARLSVLARLARERGSGTLLPRRLATIFENSEPDVPHRLNPSFVEAMMGLPIGHTELERLETPSSRRSPKSSAER